MTRYRPSRKRRPTIADLTPERALQDAQRDLAQALGFFYFHTVRSDWAGVAPGWPDTVLLGPRLSPEPALILLENKTEDGRLTDTQAEVMDVLSRVVRPPVSRLVRPSTWDEMIEEITRTAAH